MIILLVLGVTFEPCHTADRKKVFGITITIIGFVGFVLFVIFAKTYKHRERVQTDHVYRFIEDYYDNVIANYPTDESVPANSEQYEHDNMYNVHYSLLFCCSDSKHTTLLTIVLYSQQLYCE